MISVRQGETHDPISVVIGNAAIKPQASAVASILPKGTVAPKWVPETPNSSTEETLFDRRAELKKAVSLVSMHLPERWRTSIFKQIDRLLNLENWSEDSRLIEHSPFVTFLRFTIYADPKSLPGLSVAPNGHIVASWHSGEMRAFVEFLEQDKAYAVLSKRTPRGNEAVSWRGHVANLRKFVSDFGCADCFGWKIGKKAEAGASGQSS